MPLCLAPRLLLLLLEVGERLALPFEPLRDRGERARELPLLRPEQLPLEQRPVLLEPLLLQVSVVDLLPVLYRLVRVLDELDEGALLADHAVEVGLRGEYPLPVFAEAHRLLDHHEALLLRDGAQLLDHALVHDDQEVVGVDPELAEQPHDLALVYLLVVGLVPVGAVLAEVAGEHEGVRLRVGDGPLPFPHPVVEDQRDPGDVLPPPDEVAQLPRALRVGLAEGHRDGEQDRRTCPRRWGRL